MENNLIIKEVDFNGANLLAVQNSEGKIYVGVKWICKGIGLTEDQSKRQVKNIEKDLVINQGVSNLTLPTNGGIQESLCIELDFLPLWLAKISITPSMQENNPETVNKLIQYQLKAKDVLAKAFLPQYNTTDLVNTYLDMSEEDRAILYFSKLKENRLQKEIIETQKPKIDKFDKFLGTDSTHTFTDTAKIISTRCNDDGINLKISVIKLTELLRNKGILSKNKSGGKYLNHPNKEYENYFQTTSVTINEGEDSEFKRTSTRVKSNGVDMIYELVKEYVKSGEGLFNKAN